MENFKSFTVEYFVSKALSLSATPNNQYLSVYHDLLDFVQSIEKIDRKSFVVVAHIVYGWMPTILDYKFLREDDYSFYEENIKIGNCSVEFLSLIKEKINNSIVGGSKFLHFMNPEMYAIWDSKVYKALFDKKGRGYNTNNIENYIQYNLTLRDFSQKPEMVMIQNILKEKKYIDKEITNMRALETVLFYSIN
ncbi:hypothetical protein [Leptospira dzoumogneensis]|uniref:Uncharacterized protein n=1 Tax=Leptospira dzoumogneensis TaxID=2484904 RepID=A0A4Z1AE39_9LEPT|nr:hypothetical protein [Leptospira dzoumogneensis]TGN02054.1 hypothetical protein EHR06_06515 [Leptospira dzoumogneensis]